VHQNRKRSPHGATARLDRIPDVPLILGHRRDPVHPFSDAGMLAEELPNGRLLEAESFIELRTQPERLTNEIASFLDDVWSSERPARHGTARSSRRAAASTKRASEAAAKAPPAKRARKSSSARSSS